MRFELCWEPVEITPEGVIFRKLAYQEDGTRTAVPDSETLFPSDSVIISISQGPKNKIVSTTTGIDVNSRGLLVTNEHGETTRPGIFASGDVVNGAKTVVEAVRYSKGVADAMDRYMREHAGEALN